MSDKIYLGKVKSEIKKDHNPMSCEGERIWLEKHSWDCEWYWGFGYIGNNNLHCHFDGSFLGKNVWLSPSEMFAETYITDKQWWVLKDLFIQAYALKKCAEVYRHGGYCSAEKGTTDIIQDDEMCKRLNADLKLILDKIWDKVTTWHSNQN